MNALTSHLLVSVLFLFLLERVLSLLHVSKEAKKSWEGLALTLIVFYIVLGLFFKLP